MQVISGVNNSAFFAQSAYSASTASYDVNGYPITSYLPESGVGYNAVNEVSALNGSAIAQYGAEKQFLVHDDTLCHLSNSAQFALGVNLSAVAQLLGVDETVLYSGFKEISNVGSAIYELSELPTNFNCVKIYWSLNANNVFGDGNKGMGSVEYDPNLYSADTTYIHGMMNGNSNMTGFDLYRYDMNLSNIRTTAWSTRGQLTRLSDNTVFNNNAMWFHIYKIIGIGRKQ